MPSSEGGVRHAVPMIRRRSLLRSAAAASAGALALPAILESPVRGAETALAPYLEARIDWQMAKGERVHVAIIPTIFYAGWKKLASEFETLTGINVTFEEIPPGLIRNKTVLDLSSKTGTYSTHFADPMYYPLYAANDWVEPIAEYLNNPKLTDPAWYNAADLIPAWVAANSYHGKLYGIPFDGEATVQVYRTDLYSAHGLKPADTLEQYAGNAAALTDAAHRIWGAAVRGFPGPGQNMYIYPSIYLEFGGHWIDQNGKITVNGPAAEAAVEWYVNLDRKYAPPGVQNWNWPELADGFSQGVLASYIDGSSGAPVVVDPSRSHVIGKVGFARWPKGPSGRRVASIWNWGFPINKALSQRARYATWLFMVWSSCRATQERTALNPPEGTVFRVGVNRMSLLQSPGFAKLAERIGTNFLEAVSDSILHDTDPDWRPRVPQWPAVGEIMSVALQQALVGQATPKQALDGAQQRIDQVMRGGPAKP